MIFAWQYKNIQIHWLYMNWSIKYFISLSCIFNLSMIPLGAFNPVYVAIARTNFGRFQPNTCLYWTTLTFSRISTLNKLNLAEETTHTHTHNDYQTFSHGFFRRNQVQNHWSDRTFLTLYNPERVSLQIVSDKLWEFATFGIYVR